MADSRRSDPGRPPSLKQGAADTFVIRPKPPFRLDLSVWALRRLPINEVDRWDGTTYKRVLVVGEDVIELAVRQQRGGERPELQVGVLCGSQRATRGKRSAEERRSVLAEVRRALTRLLGLDVDLAPFYRLASTHERLGRLAHEFMGVKPPSFPSVFEGVVNGLACQQLSLNVGIHLLNRLSFAYGKACDGAHAFPGPDDLARADTGSLRSLGFSTRKAEYIVRVAQAVASGELQLESLRHLEDPAVMAELDRLEGVGRWTAQYVALRSLGRLDVFPADDVGGRNRVKQWLSLERRPGYEDTDRLLAPFRPYRGLIYFHLLLNRLADLGLVRRSQETEASGLWR